MWNVIFNKDLHMFNFQGLFPFLSTDRFLVCFNYNSMCFPMYCLMLGYTNSPRILSLDAYKRKVSTRNIKTSENKSEIL